MNGKERAGLRARAQELDVILHVGKDGINDNLVKQCDDALTARELIKGTVQQNCPLSAREACDALCGQTGAEGVSVIGRKFVLYRETEEE